MFSVCVFSIIGYAVCYAYQAQEDDCADGGACCQPQMMTFHQPMMMPAQTTC